MLVAIIDNQKPARANPRAVEQMANFQGMMRGPRCDPFPAAESDIHVALFFTVNNVQSNQSGGSGQGQPSE